MLSKEVSLQWHRAGKEWWTGNLERQTKNSPAQRVEVLIFPDYFKDDLLKEVIFELPLEW